MNLREQLLEIYQQNGSLTPAAVVEVARDPKHPLHGRFEWDDTVAAERYRLDQARQLIRVVKVTETRGNDLLRTREFVSVHRESGPSYMPIDEVKADPFTSKLVLQQAAREWRQMFARYRHLEEFLEQVRTDVAS